MQILFLMADGFEETEFVRIPVFIIELQAHVSHGAVLNESPAFAGRHVSGLIQCVFRIVRNAYSDDYHVQILEFIQDIVDRLLLHEELQDFPV